jgi:hypothetical protein
VELRTKALHFVQPCTEQILNCEQKHFFCSAAQENSGIVTKSTLSAAQWNFLELRSKKFWNWDHAVFQAHALVRNWERSTSFVHEESTSFWNWMEYLTGNTVSYLFSKFTSFTITAPEGLLKHSSFSYRCEWRYYFFRKTEGVILQALPVPKNQKGVILQIHLCPKTKRALFYKPSGLLPLFCPTKSSNPMECRRENTYFQTMFGFCSSLCYL